MRLSESEINSIKNTFLKFKISEEKMYLFGSRLDKNKKGGDIDLLIIFSDQKHIHSFKRLEFIIQLKRWISERKIDLTFSSREQALQDEFISYVLQSAQEL